MPSNPVAGFRIKIERAKEHIRNLEAEIASFHQRSPYAVVGEDDPQTGDWVLRARIRERPPIHWGAISGDAIHNLRASLDNLWYYLMYPGGGGEKDRGTDFPIVESAKRFESKYGRRVTGRRKPAVDILKAIKPYRGGNDALWLLHQLDILDKHKALIPAYSTVGTTIIDFSVGMRNILKGKPEWGDILPMRLGLNWAVPACPVEEGTQLWRVKADLRSEVDLSPQFPFTIAFGEAEFVRGKPIIPTLDQLAEVVDNVVLAFSGLLPA